MIVCSECGVPAALLGNKYLVDEKHEGQEAWLLDEKLWCGAAATVHYPIKRDVGYDRG